MDLLYTIVDYDKQHVLNIGTASVPKDWTNEDIRQWMLNNIDLCKKYSFAFRTIPVGIENIQCDFYAN